MQKVTRRLAETALVTAGVLVMGSGVAAAAPGCAGSCAQQPASELAPAAPTGPEADLLGGGGFIPLGGELSADGLFDSLTGLLGALVPVPTPEVPDLPDEQASSA